jgi:OOP family OmpA-OmpF porin
MLEGEIMKTGAKASLGLFLTILLTAFVLAQEKDVEGSKDHPLLSRMQNFYIKDYEDLDYDSYKFYDAKDNEYVIQGHKWSIGYRLQGGITPPGQLKVRQNYIDAIKKIGGTILYDRGVYAKVKKDGKEAWIHVWVGSDGDQYRLTIVERTIMKQEVVADPAALAGDIKAKGHVAIYGIYFDLDSSAIKPESKPTLNAIAEMLKADNSLNVYVVGHTDSTGDFDYNMQLSAKRAEAVVNALANEYGIPANRLKAKGVGPLSPVSTNKTEEGRALNRRVELVEI